MSQLPYGPRISLVELYQEKLQSEDRIIRPYDDTSIIWPLPDLRFRYNKAPQMAMAPPSPPEIAPMGQPTRVGVEPSWASSAESAS